MKKRIYLMYNNIKMVKMRWDILLYAHQWKYPIWIHIVSTGHSAFFFCKNTLRHSGEKIWKMKKKIVLLDQSSNFEIE